ncbi:amino acid permease [Chishuiella sp.]|uniref:amino acid permease n=1 Tax=Chishuiella sp. TaxID=1969467 RepID=UPI0028A63652|nr:amino acid permease [Chishuiella sp.]
MSQLFRKKSVASILAESDKNSASMKRTLGVRDLTGFGIAAIVGAGIFSTIGRASFEGGPAVIFLFIFTAIACGFTAFAYAEFASLVPVSGSAYTYSYVAFGELFAWVIGWSLIMEYAIGNIVLAISWSDYFTTLLSGMGIHTPEWMTMDYFTAKEGFEFVTNELAKGKTLDSIANSHYVQEIPKYLAYKDAPNVGFHLVVDIPALIITFLITALVYRGINESRKASNAMVVLKLAVVVLVIIVGAFYVNPDNWNPFAPNGIGGVLAGVSSVFYAYIGFDAISTTAEECKDPKRDLPRGIFASIIICTILYVVIALVITGMVHYSELNVGDPLAYVFDKINDLKWLAGIIALSAVVAMASVFIVFQIGQPRIWMTMSRDGLLPKKFSKLHPKFKTPSYATIFTGFVVGIPILFTDLELVVDACSIGTLFAFVLVCAAVIRLDADPNAIRGNFKTPFFNAKYIMPFVTLIIILVCATTFKEESKSFFNNEPQVTPAEKFVSSLSDKELKDTYITLKNITGNEVEHLDDYLSNLDEETYKSTINKLPVYEEKKTEQGWDVFKHKIPMYIFLVIYISMFVRCFFKRTSIIPLAGMLCCFYMMAQLGLKNWLIFLIWLVIGLIIYFSYGYKHSKLKNNPVVE